MFLPSNTLSFSLSSLLASFFLSYLLSHILSPLRRLRPKRNRKPAQGPAFTVSQWHASLRQAHYMSQRRCWIRSHEDGCHFGSNIFSAIPFIYIYTSKALYVFICVFPKTILAPPKNYLLVTLLLILPISFPLPCFPHSSAPPRGLVLLLTGVICASGIDVVCWPIKIFEGNVYFLERIAPAACKAFWIRPFMCKNLPLWGIV